MSNFVVLQRGAALGPQRCGGQNASRPVPPQFAPQAVSTRIIHAQFGISFNQIGPQRLWRTERKCPHIATSATAHENAADDLDDEDLEDIGLGGGEVEPIDESQLGPLPDVRHQGPMHIKDRKVWRARAEALAKDKKLIRVQVGQLGITPAFLRATADVLQKHGLVRIKLGEGCGVERTNAAAVLERYLDAVCVHQIGFTITLYRRQGLPRPSNTLPLNEEQRVQAAAEVAAAEAEAAAASAEAAARRETKKRAGQQKPQQRPPEFSVM